MPAKIARRIDQRAVAWLKFERRRVCQPIRPKPSSMVIHVAGSGTAAGGITIGGVIGVSGCENGGTMMLEGGVSGIAGGKISSTIGGIGKASRNAVLIGMGGATMSMSGGVNSGGRIGTAIRTFGRAR